MPGKTDFGEVLSEELEKPRDASDIATDHEAAVAEVKRLRGLLAAAPPMTTRDVNDVLKETENYQQRVSGAGNFFWGIPGDPTKSTWKRPVPKALSPASPPKRLETGLDPALASADDIPLVTGFGLAATEEGYPGRTFNDVLRLAKSKGGMELMPHAGEEWQEYGGHARNILDAVEVGSKRIGHGIHALDEDLPPEIRTSLHRLGASSLCELLIQRGIVLEVCPSINTMIGSAAVDRYNQPPLLQLVRKGVKVSLGSDNAGMILPAKGTRIPEELENAREMGLTRAELAELMATGFESSCAVPPVVAEKLAADARAWAATDEPIDTLPKADLHAHLNGALPLSWVEDQATQQCACCPTPFSGEIVKWKNLDEFRADYDPRSNLIKKAGGYADQILAVAQDCAEAHVFSIELSFTPFVPKGADREATLRELCDCYIEGRRRAFEQFGVYVSFVLTAIRSRPKPLKYAKEAVEDAMFMNDRWKKAQASARRSATPGTLFPSDEAFRYIVNADPTNGDYVLSNDPASCFLLFNDLSTLRDDSGKPYPPKVTCDCVKYFAAGRAMEFSIPWPSPIDSGVYRTDMRVAFSEDFSRVAGGWIVNFDSNGSEHSTQVLGPSSAIQIALS